MAGTGVGVDQAAPGRSACQTRPTPGPSGEGVDTDPCHSTPAWPGMGHRLACPLSDFLAPSMETCARARVETMTDANQRKGAISPFQMSKEVRSWMVGLTGIVIAVTAVAGTGFYPDLAGTTRVAPLAAADDPGATCS